MKCSEPNWSMKIQKELKSDHYYLSLTVWGGAGGCGRGKQYSPRGFSVEVPIGDWNSLTATQREPLQVLRTCCGTTSGYMSCQKALVETVTGKGRH